MVYGMELFDLVEGKEDVYREYWRLAGPMLERAGGRVMLAGRTARSLGARPPGYFVLAEFPGPAAYERFHEERVNEGVHELLNEATDRYQWQLLEPWDMQPVTPKVPRQPDAA